MAALGVSLKEFFKPFTKVVRPRTPRRRGSQMMDSSVYRPASLEHFADVGHSGGSTIIFEILALSGTDETSSASRFGSQRSSLQSIFSISKSNVRLGYRSNCTYTSTSPAYNSVFPLADP